MEWYEAEVRQIEQARKNTAAPACLAVFYGSSSVRLWDHMAADLGGAIVNAGFGGSTLAACVYFFERLVAPLHPRSLLVYAGDNDLGDGRRPKEVLDSFRCLIDKVERQCGSIPFGFLSVKLSPARFGIARRILETNDLIRNEIAKHPAAYFIDIAPLMLDAQSKPRPELFLEDGLHLSERGYGVWSGALREFRNKIFTADCGGIHGGTVSCGQHEPGVSQVVQSPTQS